MDGEDVVQEALFEAYRKLDKFDESRPLKPWLFRIAHNRCIDFLRRKGVRDEAATRALIVQENRHYARRQLIWFRKEPNLTWFDGPGESASAIGRVLQFLDGRLSDRNEPQPSPQPDRPDTQHRPQH